MNTFHAFTSRSIGRLREIITDIGVSLPFIEDNIQSTDNRIFRTKALWDTGATNCVVTKQTAKELNLKPISVSKVSHADGVSLANVYLVNIYLPNNLIIPNVRVTECSDSAGAFGVIIGMDELQWVISQLPILKIIQLFLLEYLQLRQLIMLKKPMIFGNLSLKM